MTWPWEKEEPETTVVGMVPKGPDRKVGAWDRLASVLRATFHLAKYLVNPEAWRRITDARASNEESQAQLAGLKVEQLRTEVVEGRVNSNIRIQRACRDFERETLEAEERYAQLAGKRRLSEIESHELKLLESDLYPTDIEAARTELLEAIDDARADGAEVDIEVRHDFDEFT